MDSITIKSWKENVMHLEDQRAQERDYFLDSCRFFRFGYLDMKKRWEEMKAKYETKLLM